jgi:hypothetical protein
MLKQSIIIYLLFSIISCKQQTVREGNVSKVLQESDSNTVFTEKVVKQESGSDFSKSYEEKELSSQAVDSVTTIMMRSSSTIRVHKNTFVYADDNLPVNELVVIKYREIKQATDVVGSSISMIYDSAGVKQNFESTGMFEFDAYTKSSGRKVKIAKGKSVEIDYVSNAKDDDYNFYKYDQGAQNWLYLSRASHQSKVSKKQATTAISEPVRPNRPSNNGTAFDLDIDVDKFPELSSYSGIIWEYAPESKADNPTKNKWIFNENWDKIKLDSYSKIKGCYQITLTSKKKTFTTVIKPALTGNDYNLAMQKYQVAMAKYSKSLVQKSNIITLRINDFGIYNIDRIASIKNQYMIEADFVLEDSQEDVSGRTVYLIYNQNRNVISYTKNGLNTWRKFIFDAKVNDNHLLMILPNNKIAIGESEDFEIIKKSGHKSYRFKLKALPKSINNIQELNNIF